MPKPAAGVEYYLPAISEEKTCAFRHGKAPPARMRQAGMHCSARLLFQQGVRLHLFCNRLFCRCGNTCFNEGAGNELWTFIKIRITRFRKDGGVPPFALRFVCAKRFERVRRPKPGACGHEKNSFSGEENTSTLRKGSFDVGPKKQTAPDAAGKRKTLVPIRHKAEVMNNKRYRQANKEALITLLLYAFFFLWWTIFAFGLGSGDPEEYSYVFGLPAWFFYSCFVGYPVIVVVLWVTVRKFFTDMPLDSDENDKSLPGKGDE